MRSIKVLLDAASIGATVLLVEQGHLHVVVREGDDRPGPTDWEVMVVTAEPTDIRPGRHLVALDAADGNRVKGEAIVRFSDGHRHLLRGDSPLDGVDAVLADP